jgi:PHD/YefM family antitoxin component YafN of YafNO toxin-antitoxin module
MYMKKSPSLLPKMYSVSALQRDYPAILRDARSSGEPVYLMKQNKPEVVLLTVDKYETMYSQLYERELAELEDSIRISEKEYAEGKIKTLSNVEDLFKD